MQAVVDDWMNMATAERFMEKQLHFLMAQAIRADSAKETICLVRLLLAVRQISVFSGQP